SQIQSVTGSSFTMVVTLNVLGQYGIRVNNPSGAQSNTFNFNTQNPVTPQITSISPASPTVNGSNQNVQVFGSNFVSGLTVTVFFPGGGSSTLSGSQIQSVTGSSFTMVVTLNVLGQYGIRVNNPSGAQSNTFNFNTQNPVTPLITSISPASPTVNGSDQNVQVFGSNFVSGLTVTVFFPGGGSSTLSGSQIQSVTSSSFTMVVTLNVLGQYGIRVNNPSGAQSNTFNFNTQNPVTPQITSISPASPTVNGSDQNVQVFGSNFVSGLTVTVFFPGGGSSTLSGSQIQSVTGSSFTMVVTLNVLGQYGIRVNNPSGAQSNNFNFTVQPQEQPADSAAFVRETIPDNAPPMTPGEKFTKTWTIRNTGTTTWASDYKLRWVGGDGLSSHTDILVTDSVSPGSNYIFSISMTAPSNPGTYRENWSLVNPNGTIIKVSSSPILWVRIQVGSSCARPIITTNPANDSVANGMSTTLRVYANGQGLTYQWYQGMRGDP